jgi:hypothetical protein
LLGEDAAGLSPTNIARLNACWEQEYGAFRRRELAGREYAYVGVDGGHFNIRLEDDVPQRHVIEDARAVWSAKFQRRSRSLGHEGILVVKSVQNGVRHHSGKGGKYLLLPDGHDKKIPQPVEQHGTAPESEIIRRKPTKTMTVHVELPVNDSVSSAANAEEENGNLALTAIGECPRAGVPVSSRSG